MAVPRIGRADLVAAVAAAHLADGASATGSSPRAPGQRAPVAEAAAELAEQLQPVPQALYEIATRVSRHCAAMNRHGVPTDAVLTEQLDELRTRTFGLWLAVQRLAEAARDAAVKRAP